MSVRKKLENKKNFKFDENDIYPAPRQIGERKSFQSRLFKKADESPPMSLRQDSGPISSSTSSGAAPGMQCDPFAPADPGLRLRRSNTPTPVKSFNYRLKIKSPEMEPMGRLNNNDVRRGKTSDTPDRKNDPVLDNIVTKLKMQYENSVTGSQHSGEPGDVSVSEATKFRGPEAGGCSCTRPLRLVLCSLCGHTEAGRVSVMCGPHPRAVFPTDLVTCSACNRGGVTFLKEFDLPSGMEEALGSVGAEQKSR